MIEMIYRPEQNQTSFCVYQNGEWEIQDSVMMNNVKLVPYSPHNNLIRNGVVLFPSDVEEYESEERLLDEIQDFIHRYLDISPLFEKVTSYYVLFSWVYDAFNELPYLRVRGDYGSGKSRFLLTVGSLCYKPIFASGASTISPLFRILDTFQGTLIIDEGDLRYSDEKTEIVKILNNGNARGFPVLRSDVKDHGEFNPRAYTVFGPKLVATRGFFQDQALESRFVTEEMGHSRLRKDIPINLPGSLQEEARSLRNKLLLFRFRNFRRIRIKDDFEDGSLEPRLKQIFLPLLSVIENSEVKADILELARRYNRELITERGMAIEGQVLEIIRDMIDAEETPLSVKEITSWFLDRYGEDYSFDRKITPKWMGFILRKRLQVKTQKSHGVYIIPGEEKNKLELLFEKYGIREKDYSDPSSEECD